MRVFTLPKHRSKGGAAGPVDSAAAVEQGAGASAKGAAPGTKGKAGGAKKPASSSRRRANSSGGGGGGAQGASGSANAAAAAALKKKRARVSLADSPVVKNRENDREQNELKAYRGADWRDVEALEVRSSLLATPRPACSDVLPSLAALMHADAWRHVINFARPSRLADRRRSGRRSRTRGRTRPRLRRPGSSSR